MSPPSYPRLVLVVALGAQACAPEPPAAGTSPVSAVEVPLAGSAAAGGADVEGPGGAPAGAEVPAAAGPAGPRVGSGGSSPDGGVGGTDGPDPLADIEQVVDESRRSPEDPEEWVPLASYAGRDVVVRREFDPDGTRLMRIFTALAETPEGELPVPHGPDWRYFETGLPSRVDHWLAGIAHGPQRSWWRTGRLREEGTYVAGTRVGPWRRWGRMGQPMFEGTFRDGRPDGVHREWFADGQLEDEVTYLDGQLEGRHRTWGRNGVLVLDEQWKAGVRHGRWSDFHATSGQPRTWGEYDSDRRVGVWRVGREDGAGLLLQEAYVEGRRHGLARRWSPEGQLVTEDHWEDDVKSGPVKTWYPSGQPQSEGVLEAGRRVGDWTYWSPDGSVNERWTGRYEDDRMVQETPLDDR